MNPAALLHARLTAYRAPAGEVALVSRFHISDDSVSRVISDLDRAAMLESARWLTKLETILADLESGSGTPSVFRRYIPIWTNAAMAIGLPWNTSTVNPEELCPSYAMDMLESLATQLDMLTPRPETAALERLQNLVAQVSELIDEDTTLDDHLRIHLRRVVDHLRDCVEHPEAYDLHEMAVATDDVLVATRAAAAESTDDACKARWAKFRDLYIAPTVTGLVASTTAPVFIEAASSVVRAIGY